MSTPGEPLEVGGLTLRNRFVMTPHLGRLRKDRLFRYVEERVRHGVAMVVLPAGDAVYGMPGAYADSVSAALGSAPTDTDEIGYGPADAGYGDQTLPALRSRLVQLADLVHQHGAHAVGQIYHPGAEQAWDNFQPAVAPSAVRADASARIPHALTSREIDRLVTAYAVSAAVTIDSGLDGIELHAGHGYLLNRFLSPHYNQRIDDYGGSREGRLRLLTRILDEIRQRVGPGPLLGIRLPVAEEVPGGLTTSDIADLAEELSGRLSYLSVSLGNHDGLRDGRPTTAYTAPWLVEAIPAAEASRQIRERVACPVLVTGRVTTAEHARRLLDSGAADLVGLARALIADPRFAERALSDRPDRIVTCIGCNECTLVPFSCTVNPQAGREAELLPRPTSQRKRIVVVGAGPAGVAAATTAAGRGHDVVLLDGAPEVGGTVTRLARAGVLRAWDSFSAQLQRQVRESTVDFRPGCVVSAADVASHDPAVVVIATGAVSAPAGLDADGDVRSGYDVLGLGRTEANGPIVVIGGSEPHLEPLLLVEAMLAGGRPVTLLTEHMTAGPGVEPRTLNFYVGKLLQAGVTIVPMTRARAWRDGMLRGLQLFSGQESTYAADVVVAVGQRCAADALAREVEQLLPAAVPVHVIGDALAPRRLTHAALEGARIGTIV